jgi:hypothetical protein
VDLVRTYENDPKKAPPEKVALIAPIVAEVFVVLKVLKKLGDWMTRVITPTDPSATCINRSEAVLRTTIITEQKASCGGEHRQYHIEEETHLAR